MKVRATTDLAKYGFKKTPYQWWHYAIEDYSGEGNDSDTPVRVMISIDTDREICIAVDNDHVRYNVYNDESGSDVMDLFKFDEVMYVPRVLFQLFANDEIEPEANAA